MSYKKVFLVIFAIIFYNKNCVAIENYQNCFTYEKIDIKTNTRRIISNGQCGNRYSPCSTFKIALSLIGFDSGIFIDKLNPEWNLDQHDKKLTPIMLPIWSKTQNPQTWMKESCVWYSQMMTQKLGMKRFIKYINKFNYGDKNIYGFPGVGNGLTLSWLSNSLQISPLEQIEFLKKLYFNKLKISKKAQQLTKDLIFQGEIYDGWRLYGKTGSGFILNEKNERTEIQHGWFVGWLERENQIIFFAYHLVDKKAEKEFGGPRAKIRAIAELKNLI